ncbi:MAG: MaoC family dehydratase N-terminal domain-containing protein [Erythrobacter sp.]|nr:MaoC family dehydratase N-terminal domain-containing protein [Erythrobacter sp.]
MAADLPAQVQGLLGQPCFAQVSDGLVEAGAIRLFAAAVQDGTAEYWSEDPAEVCAPPAMLSAWNRPLMWRPGEGGSATGLALHFLLKEQLGLPLAVVTATETELAQPLRPGARVQSEQVLLSVSEPKTNRLGTGRYWTIRVDYRCAATGALFGHETMSFFGYVGDSA